MRVSVKTLLLMQRLGVLNNLENDVTFIVHHFPTETTSVHMRDGEIVKVIA